jgi:GT2 family glycosyltransferase
MDYMFRNPDVGICSGVVRDIYGRIDDNLRRLPKFSLIIRRYILRTLGINIDPDYLIKDTPFHVDWIAGLFMLTSSNAFSRVGGFDQNYFMYYEDADLCIRCRLAGYSVICHPSLIMTHNARRASFKNVKHLIWHVKSVFKAIKIARSFTNCKIE